MEGFLRRLLWKDFFLSSFVKICSLLGWQNTAAFKFSTYIAVFFLVFVDSSFPSSAQILVFSKVLPLAWMHSSAWDIGLYVDTIRLSVSDWNLSAEQRPPTSDSSWAPLPERHCVSLPHLLSGDCSIQPSETRNTEVKEGGCLSPKSLVCTLVSVEKLGDHSKKYDFQEFWE